MERQNFDNVWDALADTPAEAASLTLRTELMVAIEQQVRSWAVTQDEAARRLGVTQPRLNDLLRGKIAKFSLDALVDLARAGWDGVESFGGFPWASKSDSTCWLGGGQHGCRDLILLIFAIVL